MKLGEALRQIISENGTAVIGEERLPELLAGKDALENVPGLPEAVRAFAAEGLGKRLTELSSPDGRGQYAPAAPEAVRTLSEKCGISRGAAQFLIDSVLFALGVTEREAEAPAKAPEERTAADLSDVWIRTMPDGMPGHAGKILNGPAFFRDMAPSPLPAFGSFQKGKPLSSLLDVRWHGRAPGKGSGRITFPRAFPRGGRQVFLRRWRGAGFPDGGGVLPEKRRGGR